MVLLLQKLPTLAPKNTQPPVKTDATEGRRECREEPGQSVLQRSAHWIPKYCWEEERLEDGKGPCPSLSSDQLPVTGTLRVTDLCPFSQRTALASRLLDSGVHWDSASICAFFLKQVRPGCGQVEQCLLCQSSWGSASCKALALGNWWWKTCRHPKALGWKYWYHLTGLRAYRQG